MHLHYDPDIFDAIAFDDLESLKMYWQASIDINFREKNGNTMLMLAAHHGFEDIFEFLLSKGPNVDLKNDKGQTAGDIAKENGYLHLLLMMEAYKESQK
jgi:ankyrin repeat protein